MARFVTGFVVEDIVQAHRLFEKVILHAQRVGDVGTVKLLTRAYTLFNIELNELAVVGAADAQKKMREVYDKTAKRKSTGITPHLKTKLTARPIRTVGRLGTGVVGIADVDVLDRAVSPVDGFAYWRVQEEGTRALIGRVLKGFFYDKGFANPTRPAKGYTGNKQLAQPLFRTAKSGPGGKKGGAGGKGVIQNPIRARHFIRDGAAAAYPDWLAGLKAVEDGALINIRAALGGGRVKRKRRRP